MLKILAPVVILIIIATAVVFIKYGSNNSPKVSNLNPVPVTSIHESPESSTSALVSDSTNLTVALPSGSSLEARVANLEAVVQVLQRRIDLLEKKSSVTVLPTTTSAPTVVSPTSKPVPVYIPLGSSSSITSDSYYNLDYFAASVDPADYPGLARVTLEVSMNIPSIVGTAYAQLYNATDGKVVSGSEVSTTSGDYVLLTSGGFSLASGKKTYYLQAKSSQSALVNIQNARLKVSF